ncbi:NUAK family SNF1-like kinase 1 [Polypterus senegalus]|nr:NUAK family SNF1-like kinase 1 [Polypterus senegalus]
MTGVTWIGGEGDSCGSASDSSRNISATCDESGSLGWERRAGAGGVRRHHHKHNLKHRYEVLETLGKGTYGKVKKAVERSTGKTVAIKSIRKDRITDDLDRVHIQREIEIMSSLRHPNIICIYEVFESKDKIIIVMEYASRGELYDYVSSQIRIPEAEARKFFRQITSALHYCHKNNIVHRDLKLENILLDEDYSVKLADFGLSTHFKKSQMLQTYCGSPLYASPEIVNGLPYHGPEVDCWALGVLLYSLVYGNMPFDSRNYKHLTEQISAGKYRKPQQPSDAYGLINWMLTVNVEQRATIEDISQHWWVNWGFDKSICDCVSSQNCPSPLLARYIDWQNTTTAKDVPDDKHYIEFSLHSRSSGEATSCLKKSKKENDITQPQQETFTRSLNIKPKGILKTKSSFDASFVTSSLQPCLSQLCAKEQLSHDPVHMSNSRALSSEPSAKMPKKGILKKLYQRESGYSSSPERGDSLDNSEKCESKQDEERCHTANDVVLRRKGILKRNGKFSCSLDLPDDRSTLKLSESLKQLILSGGYSGNQQQTRAQSRPPSVISDDSLLSGDSFDILDLATAETKRLLFTERRKHTVYSSEEDPEDGEMKGEKNKDFIMKETDRQNIRAGGGKHYAQNYSSAS